MKFDEAVSDLLNVEVSVEPLKVANPDATDLSIETARLLALGLFREEKVSLGGARNYARTRLANVYGFCCRSYADPLPDGEFEEDRHTLAALGL